MAKDKTFRAWINPLALLDVDEPWASMDNRCPTLDAIVRFLCPPGMPTDVESLTARYKAISTEAVRLFAAPAEPQILEKLVWPLRHAKGSYVVGNYLAVVALCGMVAEMLAMLVWEIGEPTMNGRPMTEADEKALFNSSFERLGQDRRVRVLAAYEMIDATTQDRFETIRGIRRKYLHIWSQDQRDLDKDAKDCFHAAVALVTNTIGQGIEGGKIGLNPRLIAYLERKGVCQPSELEDASSGLVDGES